MIVFSISNQKGGVAKTSSAIAIAAELALRKFRTLLVDGDPQGNTTRMFYEPGTFSKTLVDVIFGSSGTETLPIESVILPTSVEGLDLVPANIALARFEAISSDRLAVLRKKLAAVSGVYDYVVIDTPPTLGKLLLVSLLASDHTLVPVSASPYGEDGLVDLIESHQNLKEMGSRTDILGMFTTLFDTRVGICGASHEALKHEYGDLVFETIIHRNSKIEESPAFMKPVQLHAPTSRGARLYAELTDEILGRIGMPLSKEAAVGDSTAEPQAEVQRQVG